MKVLSAVDFWENVKAEISQAGITQRELCSRCGFNEGSFKNRVSKKVFPTIDEVYLMAQVLDVSIDRLSGNGRESVPQEIIDIAYEINALPDVYRKIVIDTVNTLRSNATEKAGERTLNFG